MWPETCRPGRLGNGPSQVPFQPSLEARTGVRGHCRPVAQASAYRGVGCDHEADLHQFAGISDPAVA
jgi:hypothetical protein